MAFHIPFSQRSAYGIASVALAASLVCTPSISAFAVTAAEKQAEADAVFAQIDSLQTSLNEAQARYDQALEERDAALEKRDAAQKRYDKANARIKELREQLAAYAVANYKQDSSSYLDVILKTESFSDFMTSLDIVSAINKQGAEMINDTEDARTAAKEAKAEYEEQGQLAEQRMAEAEEKERQIEETQEALREEAAKLSAEAAELQAKEEEEAEAARQAEEARKKREEALALAAKEAEEAAAAQAASEDPNVAVAASAGSSVIMGSGFFANPCPKATSSSGFGYRTFDNSFHKGLDMAAPSGTPYYAAESGTVIYATNDGGYNGGAGNWIVISHGNGIVTKYMHSSATYVKPGDQVERGQNIGAVGETGQAFGAHLHFQVEVDGVAVNPLNYI